MSRILVTGGAGFVGRRLVDRLKMEGYNLRVISREQVPGVETVICDFLEGDIPENAFDGVDTVFHLAGYVHDLRAANYLGLPYRKVNVDATTRLLILSVEYGVKCFVFVSSVKAGGSALPGKCMTEEDQGEPEGVYGQTKREAEVKVLEAGFNSDMHVSIVRSSLVYGAGVKGNLRLMLSGIEYGWFPPLPDTGNRRSMIHVDDLVESLLLVAKEDRANGEIFVATDRQDYSTRAIYCAMVEAVGRKVPNWIVPELLFSLASCLNGRIKEKVEKLLGDSCYSSEKLGSLGYVPKRTLQSALPEMVSAFRRD